MGSEMCIRDRAWILQPDGWVEAEYDVSLDAWYFKANRTPYMPYCVLMEIALQTCGWLAAYAGSALKSEKDLRFRNLEGSGLLHQDITAGFKTLTIRSRLTKVSTVEDTIIEAFDFEILQGAKLIFEGNTVFGFFTADALARQRGIPESRQNPFRPPPGVVDGSRTRVLEDKAPHAPDDPDTHWNLGILNDLYLKRPQQALEHCERYRQLTGSEDPQLLLWIAQLKLGTSTPEMTADVK